MMLGVARLHNDLRSKALLLTSSLGVINKAVQRLSVFDEGTEESSESLGRLAGKAVQVAEACWGLAHDLETQEPPRVFESEESAAALFDLLDGVVELMSELGLLLESNDVMRDFFGLTNARLGQWLRGSVRYSYIKTCTALASTSVASEGQSSSSSSSSSSSQSAAPCVSAFLAGQAITAVIALSSVLVIPSSSGTLVEGQGGEEEGEEEGDGDGDERAMAEDGVREWLGLPSALTSSSAPGSGLDLCAELMRRGVYSSTHLLAAAYASELAEWYLSTCPSGGAMDGEVARKGLDAARTYDDVVGRLFVEAEVGGWRREEARLTALTSLAASSLGNSK